MKKAVIGFVAIGAVLALRPAARHMKKMAAQCEQMAAQCKQMAAQPADRGEAVKT